MGGLKKGKVKIIKGLWKGCTGSYEKDLLVSDGDEKVKRAYVKMNLKPGMRLTNSFSLLPYEYLRNV